jgi:hypothetical protein
VNANLNILMIGLDLDKECINNFNFAIKNKSEVIRNQGRFFILNNFPECFKSSKENLTSYLYGYDYSSLLDDFLNENKDGIMFKSEDWGEVTVSIDFEYFFKN